MYKDIYIINPSNKSIINNKRPKISVFILNTNYYSKITKIKMYINNKKVSYNTYKNQIIYIPKKNLSPKKYNIKIVLKSSDNIKKTVNWSFSIHSDKNPCKKYKFLYGIPHCHTSFSTGKGLPSDAFKYAYKKGLDFLIITDHCQHIAQKIQLNSSEENKWTVLHKQASNFNKNHTKFLALKGFEVSSYKYGDFNVLNTNNIFKYKIKSFDKFISWLKNENKAIVCINHPHKYIKNFQYNNDLKKFVNYIEVGNGSYPCKYLNGEKYYYKLLDSGWYLGALNGQDNHKSNWGDSDNLTVVLSKSINYKDFIEALKNRRTYSTETRSLKLIFMGNNHYMGSIIKESNEKKLYLTIVAEDKKVPINKIQIISNGGNIIKEKTFDKKLKIKWNISLNYLKEKWYVAKIIHYNNRCGISSPIFTQ